MTDSLYFVHISDSHLGGTREWVAPSTGENPCERLERVVAAIADLPTPPRFVVHTGDVANDEEKSAYVLALEIFSRLEMPLYFARGNHDTLAFMEKHLSMGPRVDLLPGLDCLCYAYSYGDDTPPELTHWEGPTMKYLPCYMRWSSSNSGSPIPLLQPY
jgi:metallophosphoesterase superfamily enzyme